jgi:hypothetical protein
VHPPLMGPGSWRKQKPFWEMRSAEVRPSSRIGDGLVVFWRLINSSDDGGGGGGGGIGSFFKLWIS